MPRPAPRPPSGAPGPTSAAPDPAPSTLRLERLTCDVDVLRLGLSREVESRGRIFILNKPKPKGRTGRQADEGPLGYRDTAGGGGACWGERECG